MSKTTAAYLPGLFLSTAPAFTLIEILIVVSIVGILMAAAIPTFNSYNKAQILSQAASSVKTDLRAAQNFSLSGSAGKVWGLRFVLNSSTYYLFDCFPGSPASAPLTTNYGFDPTNPAAYPDCVLSKARELSPTVRVTSANLNIAFEAVTGAVIVNGSPATAASDIILDFVSGVASPKHVCVTRSGGVSEEPAGCP